MVLIVWASEEGKLNGVEILNALGVYIQENDLRNIMLALVTTFQFLSSFFSYWLVTLIKAELRGSQWGQSQAFSSKPGDCFFCSDGEEQVQSLSSCFKQILAGICVFCHSEIFYHFQVTAPKCTSYGWESWWTTMCFFWAFPKQNRFWMNKSSSKIYSFCYNLNHLSLSFFP